MSTKKAPSKSTVKKTVKKPDTKKTTARKAVKKTTKKTTTKTNKKPAKKATKKTAKKTTTTATKAVKKATKKAKATTKGVTKMLVCAPDGDCFWTTDGQVLRDLHDLKLALGTMDNTVFMYHVTEDKNDFADWVEHVLQDYDCAEALRSCQSPKKAKTTVTTYLRYYTA